MKCLILAGGFGTRLLPLNVERPKALLEYKGKPLLTYIVEKIPHYMDALVTINRKNVEDFRRWQDATVRPVEICIEDVWAGGGGAVNSLDFWINHKNISEDLLVIAGDNYFDFDILEFMAAYNGRNVLVAVYNIGDRKKATQYGVVCLEGHKIVRLDEKPSEPVTSFIATACYIFPPRIFSRISQYCSKGRRDNLGSFISYLIETDEVNSYTSNENWFDIGSELSLTDLQFH